MLAMDPNDDAYYLNKRVVFEFFASKPQAGARSYSGSAQTKMPRTWRGIFSSTANDHSPSSIALLRTAPLSALVASRA